MVARAIFIARTRLVSNVLVRRSVCLTPSIAARMTLGDASWKSQTNSAACAKAIAALRTCPTAMLVASRATVSSTNAFMAAKLPARPPSSRFVIEFETSSMNSTSAAAHAGP